MGAMNEVATYSVFNLLDLELEVARVAVDVRLALCDERIDLPVAHSRLDLDLQQLLLGFESAPTTHHTHVRSFDAG